ncbi:MAG: universal stress protein [Dehalococcoidia bacterium]
MFKKMLVPLDGSESTEMVGSWAAGLGSRLDAEVGLLAVVNPAELQRSSPTGERYLEQPPPGPGPGVADRSVDQATRYVEGAKRRLSSDGPQSIIAHVSVGSPAEHIVSKAEELGADVIAMATHRERAPVRGILGSVTDRVLHSSRIPVLVVYPRSPTVFRDRGAAPEVVVVPLDGSSLSERAVEPGLELARACNASVAFIRVAHSQGFGTTGLGWETYAGAHGALAERQQARDYLDPFLDMAEQAGLTATAFTPVGAPAARIVTEAEQTDGALIVMSTRGATGVNRWALGSVTDKVVRTSDVPVLVIPPAR